MPYSVTITDDRSARAYGRELRTSWKNAINIVKAIRGMNVRRAETYLENVIALKQAVPYRVHFGKVPHRRGIGPGRYPRRSADRILRVLQNAVNNAEYQNLDPDQMVIVHASAYKGRILEGWMPRARGRATPNNEETCNVEIVIREPADDAADKEDS